MLLNIPMYFATNRLNKQKVELFNKYMSDLNDDELDNFDQYY